MSGQQISIDLAAVMRDVGIARATDHAERDSPGITDVMLAYVEKFCRARSRDDIFTAEDIVDAYNRDARMEKPANDKAWGGVLRRACAQRCRLLELIDREGKRRKGNCSPCPRYRSLIGRAS